MSAFVIWYWSPNDPIEQMEKAEPRQTEWICPTGYDETAAERTFLQQFPGSLVVDCLPYLQEAPAMPAPVAPASAAESRCSFQS